MKKYKCPYCGVPVTKEEIEEDLGNNLLVDDKMIISCPYCDEWIIIKIDENNRKNKCTQYNI